MVIGRLIGHRPGVGRENTFHIRLTRIGTAPLFKRGFLIRALLLLLGGSLFLLTQMLSFGSQSGPRPNEVGSRCRTGTKDRLIIRHDGEATLSHLPPIIDA